MAFWFRVYYGDEDLWLYFEADDEGHAARKVEVRRADSWPVGAASLAEVLFLRDHGGPAAVDRYERRFGAAAEGNVVGWREWPNAGEITAVEFERLWDAARRALGDSV